MCGVCMYSASIEGRASEGGTEDNNMAKKTKRKCVCQGGREEKVEKLKKCVCMEEGSTLCT